MVTTQAQNLRKSCFVTASAPHPQPFSPAGEKGARTYCANTFFLASVRFCELHDLLRVHGSRLTSNLASRLEQYHGWDTGDSELRCCQRGYFGIQFRENDLG